jgi:hypothetical protein
MAKNAILLYKEGAIMAVLKDGKTENLTIRVDPDFKKRVEAVRQQYFARIPMNIFLEMMVEVGMEVEEQFAALKKEMIADVAKKQPSLFTAGQLVQEHAKKSGKGEGLMGDREAAA